MLFLILKFSFLSIFSWLTNHRLTETFLNEKNICWPYSCVFICCSNSKRADTNYKYRTTSCVFEHSISTTRTNMYIAISLFQNMTFMTSLLLCFNYCFHQKLIINFHHYSLPISLYHFNSFLSFPILYIHPHKKHSQTFQYPPILNLPT